MVGCRVDEVKLYFFFFFKAIESVIQLNIVTMGVTRVGIVTRKIIRETKYKFQYISHIIRNLILLLFFLMDDCKDNISVFVFIFTTNFGESFKGGTSLFFGKVLLVA